MSGDSCNDDRPPPFPIRPPAARPDPRGAARCCSRAGERSSIASARSSSSSPIILAAASLVLASKASSALSSGGWFDPTSESATVSQRLADEYDAGRATIVALFRGAPGADARSASFQGEIADSLDRLAADSRVNGVIGYAQTHDDRFISTDGTMAYVVLDLAISDEAAVDAMPRDPRAHRPAVGSHAPADRRRAGDRRPGPPVREGAGPGRVRLVPVRRADPDPRLRLARRRGHAADRGRPRDPDDARRRLRRRPVHRALDLRPERRDDARPGARDRLLAVHGQPLPRGAAQGPRRRRPPSRSPSRRAARP